MKGLNFWLSGVVAVALIAGASAQVWNEVGDAGDLPGTAQSVLGNFGDQLREIRGTISSSTDVDMYLIYIKDIRNFGANTIGGGNLSDPQLFLFNANGIGVVHDDDESGLQPVIGKAGGRVDFPNFGISYPDWGSYVTAAGLTNGFYYLAISAFNRDAASAGGLIWGAGGFGGYQRGPDGPGAGGAVSGWTGTGGTGTYTIFLQGAAFVPEPASMMALGVGLAGLLGLRRRVKK